MSTGFIWDERFAWFDTGDVGRGPFFTPLGAFNTRESKERIRELLVATGQPTADAHRAEADDRGGPVSGSHPASTWRR